jgi:beta-ureidopropionase
LLATPSKRTRAGRERLNATTTQGDRRLWRVAKGKQRDTNGSTLVPGVINIEAPRDHRDSIQVTNWMKDVRSELAQIICEKPFYPKDRYQKKISSRHAQYEREAIEKHVALTQRRGIWKKPANSPG